MVLRGAAAMPRAVLVAALCEPSAEGMTAFSRGNLEFAGFDVVDVENQASALLNCGGFPDVFAAEELSPESGLIMCRDRAYEIREMLARLHPDEAHAQCHVWALWTVRTTA